MNHRPLLYPSILAAIGMLIIGVCAVFGQPLPPMPPVPSAPLKAQSPKAAALAATAGKAMAVSMPPVVTTNEGAVAATFQPTQIQGLQAGFVYRTSMTNDVWKVLGTVPYPPNGGPVMINFSGTNLPMIYFKAFYQFPSPATNAY